MLTFAITQPDGSLFSLDFVPQTNPLEVISTLSVNSSFGFTFKVIIDQAAIDSIRLWRQYFSVVYQSQIDFSGNFSAVQDDCLTKSWQNTVFNAFKGILYLLFTYFSQLKQKIVKLLLIIVCTCVLCLVILFNYKDAVFVILLF